MAEVEDLAGSLEGLSAAQLMEKKETIEKDIKEFDDILQTVRRDSCVCCCVCIRTGPHACGLHMDYMSLHVGNMSSHVNCMSLHVDYMSSRVDYMSSHVMQTTCWTACGRTTCGLHVGLHVDYMWTACGLHVDCMWITCHCMSCG